MPNRLTDLDVHTVSLVNRAAVRDPQNKSEPRRLLLWKREGVTSDPPTPGGEDMPTPTLEELQEQLTKKDEELAARDETISKLQAKPPRKASDDDDDENESSGSQKSEIDKSELAPEVREYLEKQERETTEARKRADEAVEKAETERNVRVEREFVAKAEADFGGLAADPNDLGPVMKRASETLEKADYEVLESVLKGASAAVKEGELFKQMGRDGQPARPSSALEELEKHASDIRKSDSSITEAEALHRAQEAHPELKQRYTAELMGA